MSNALHVPINGRNHKKIKKLKNIVKLYDKPEHILIIVQGSDNKIMLFIKIVFNEGKRKKSDSNMQHS